MQVTETLNDGLKRGYTITLPAAELDAKVQEKLVEAQPEVAMKGFRKGKVPLSLLKKQFGPRVLGEAMQESIDGALSNHLEESGDRPAMQPEVKMANDDWKEGDDVEVTVSYEKLPEIPEADFSDVEIERLKVVADDAAIDEALGNLAETAQNFEDKDGEAEEGDQVVIDFLGKIDGEAFEGGAAEDYPLTLGSNSFIPGFEEQLVGVKAGDEKTVEVKFPEEYGAENLAGKDASFDVTVKAVKEPVDAEVDDELAKKFGAEDLESLKGQIRERLEAGDIDNFDGRQHDLRIANLDRAYQDARKLMRDRIPGIVSQRKKRFRVALPKEVGETQDLLRELKPIRGQKTPIRTLITKYGESLTDVMPCLLMSPDSVATLLPVPYVTPKGEQRSVTFDLVIFDEASQVREADAICAIYRGDQLIVAGDQKQLPPTSFFDRMIGFDESGDGGEEDFEALEFDSVLDRCKAQGFTPLGLQWHYRSRHEDLITYSNRSFYDSKLLTFPGAVFEAPHLGVELFKVDGVYARGGAKTNPIEAAAVVERILFHRRNHPDPTIGVVTLSAAQEIAVETEAPKPRRRRVPRKDPAESVTPIEDSGVVVKEDENDHKKNAYFPL